MNRSTIVASRTRRLALLVLLASAASVSACVSGGAPTVPWRHPTRIEHELQDVPDAERALLWVSYQMRVEAIDGVAVDYAAPGACVYYALVLPAGAHRLRLRLDYRGPLDSVRSDEVVELAVSLAPGGAQRLIDLGAGEQGPRRFLPWLAEGAPPEGELEREPGGPPAPQPASPAESRAPPAPAKSGDSSE